MDGMALTKERLAALLRQAEEAHGAYERTLGHRDDDWPVWYAGYIVDRLQQEQSTEDIGRDGAPLPGDRG